jgi:nucleotide sugar dehydrogenase
MPVRDCETAELSKLAELTYRDVNIAFANELAMAAQRAGVDVLEAIAAANSQPYSHIHQPGVGVGGHCIPVYPYFLGATEAEIIGTARRINDDMARYGIEKLESALGTLAGATVVVLGLSFRAGVKEPRHSSTFALVDALAARDARAFVHDPLFTPAEVRALGLEPPPEFPLSADALVVQAWHAQYAELDLTAFDGLRAVLDGRGALDPADVQGRGITYVGIGR